MTLRLPQTLNARLGGGPLAASASHVNPLLDWSVRAFAVGQTEFVLLSNTRSLYSTAYPVRRESSWPNGSRVPLGESSTEPTGS